MENQTAIQVAKWLLAREHISTATPVIVKIGRRTYSAAKYFESHNGADEERLYLIGDLPPLHSRRRVCYTTDAAAEDTWHLISWQRTACTEWQEVHFGNSHFILARFSSLHSWAADQCGRRPYRQIEMRVTEVGPTDAGVGQHDEENKE